MFGHFSISFRELIRTFFRLNKDEKNTEQLEKELKVFAVDKVMYEGFIERYNLLHAFRKNMTWISVILCFINLIYVLIDNAHVPFYLVSVIICLILILVFGFNTDNTKHELLRRIDSTHKLVKGKVEPDNKKKETDK